MEATSYFQIIRIIVYLFYLINTTFHLITNKFFTIPFLILTILCVKIDLIDPIRQTKKDDRVI